MRIIETIHTYRISVLTVSNTKDILLIQGSYKYETHIKYNNELMEYLMMAQMYGATARNACMLQNKSNDMYIYRCIRHNQG